MPASARLSRLLERERLTASLRSELEARSLIAITAPAGYGKTAALAAALAGERRPVVWYRARAWHQGEFLAPLVAEIRTVRPDFGRMTLALAKRHPSGDSQIGAQSALLGGRLGASFAAELGHVCDELIVVIDDAQNLDDDPLFAPFLAAALEALPSTVRMAVLARSAPRLPFAAWIAQGRCATFSSADLRFDDDEVRELARRFGVEGDVPVAGLRERFDGWAAGLALFFAAGERTVPAEGRSLDAYGAYLIDANLAALDARLLAFLEATCAYERLDASILERDRSIADVRPRLAALERSGVMVAVEQPGALYRLHPLLREALRDRVRTRDGDEALAAAHRRAAETFEATGALEAALDHVERANDGAFATAFFVRHAHELFVAGSGERAARIARKFAARSPLASAVAALLDGMLLRQYGLPGAAERFESGLRAARSGGAAGLETALRLVATEDALARREPPSAADLHWLEGVASDESDPRSAAEASMYAGWTRAIAGDFTRARESSRRALALAGHALAGRVRATALDAYAATCLGRFDEADRELNLVLAELETSDALVLLANTLVWYARLSLLWGDVAVARDYAQQGHVLAKRLDLSAELAGVAVARAQIASHEGDLVALRDAASDARRFGSSAWYVADRDRSLALATLLDARASFVALSPAEALRRLAAHEDPMPPVQGLCAAVDAAAYRRAAGDPRALESAARSLAVAGDVRAYDALDAVELARAIELARTLELDVPAILERMNSANFGGLLKERRAREEREHGRRDPSLVAFARRAHESAPAKRSSAGSAARDVGAAAASGLTKREREILELLSAGLTNKEMAQRLVVSPRTVDTHVERVLSKLGVPSRTRAVAAALRMGLVAAP